MTEATQPEALDVDRFPRGGNNEEKLRFALRWAVRPSSSHNSQPWRFPI